MNETPILPKNKDLYEKIVEAANYISAANKSGTRRNNYVLLRQPDDYDDMPEYIQMKCEICGWIDDFTIESLNKENCVEGYCDDCEQHEIFIQL